MLRWVDAVHTGSQHRDGTASGGQCRPVGFSVDAPGQAADDCQTGSGQATGQKAGHPSTVPGATAAADDRHCHLVHLLESPADIEQVGGIGDLREQWRVGRGPSLDQADAVGPAAIQDRGGLGSTGRPGDCVGHARSDPGDRQQLLTGCGQDLCRLTDVFQQQLEKPGTDSRHQLQSQSVQKGRVMFSGHIHHWVFSSSFVTSRTPQHPDSIGPIGSGV